ncbi:MAG TPA: hypothetical protein PLA94_06720 [Myxococcota bacterium]|nr:hypothetical protein [Myxococcota bacterium]
MKKHLLVLCVLPFLYSGSSTASPPEEDSAAGQTLGLDGRLAVPPMPPAEPLPAATVASLLPRAQPLDPRFSWPASDAFESAWEEVPQQSWGLARGRWVKKRVPEAEVESYRSLSVAQAMARLEAEDSPITDVVTRYRKVGGQLELEPLHVFGDRYGLYNAVNGRLEPLGALWHDKDLVVAWQPTVEEPPQSAQETEQATWAYARTLLGFEGDPSPPPVRGLKDDPAAEAAWERWEAAGDAGEKKKAALELLASKMPSQDDRWGALATWAEETQNSDLELAVLRRYRPVGRCSMDLRPQILASRYGDLCFQVGKLGCTLHLQVRVMASNFDRVAWSSYGDAAASTESAHLWKLGIEARRFLMAFVLDYPDQSLPVNVGLYRLGRGMAESPEVDRLTGHVRAWAEDPALDASNRLNAALVLLNIRSQSYGSYAQPAAELAELKLHPLAQAVIADVAAME